MILHSAPDSNAYNWARSFADDCISRATEAAKHPLDNASPDQDQVCFTCQGSIAYNMLNSPEPQQDIKAGACFGL